MIISAASSMNIHSGNSIKPLIFLWPAESNEKPMPSELSVPREIIL